MVPYSFKKYYINGNFKEILEVAGLSHPSRDNSQYKNPSSFLCFSRVQQTSVKMHES